MQLPLLRYRLGQAFFHLSQGFVRFEPPHLLCDVLNAALQELVLGLQGAEGVVGLFKALRVMFCLILLGEDQRGEFIVRGAQRFDRLGKLKGLFLPAARHLF